MTTADAFVPPQNLEAEESVLGAMMVSETAVASVVVDVHLTADDFYMKRHATIFEAVHKLHARGEPVDALTVTEQLTQMGNLTEAGGKDLVSSFASTVPVPGNADHYAKIVKANAMLRRLLTASHKIQQSVHERGGEPRDLVEQAEKMMFEVAHDTASQDFAALSDILLRETTRLEELSEGKRDLTGTPSGFIDLDAITGGFQPGNLIIVAARPAMGKSAWVGNIADFVGVEKNLPVAFFSLEMSETELAHRFLACRASIRGDLLRKGQVKTLWQKVLRASNQLENAPIWIDASADLSVLELRAKARRLYSREGGLGLIIVDYLQLMRADDPRMGRVEQVGSISRGLKLLASELNVPVLGLSQLSRAPEQRTDKAKRPILSDLRESGCITGDALVYLPDTGRYEPIASLVGKSEFNVLAVDEKSWKLTPSRVTHAFATGFKSVFCLRTKLGRDVKATANHKFLTLHGWRRLDQLSEGDHVALPRVLPGPCTNTMSRAELALLGHLIGDGCTLPRHAAWLSRLGVFGLRSYEKRIPDEVFRQSTESVAIFLRHLWSTDGSITFRKSPSQPNRHPHIYFATSSAQLVRDVQALLLRLGINARRRVAAEYKGRQQHHLIVSGRQDVQVFVDRIGGLGEAKQEATEAISAWLGTRPSNTNRDTAPADARSLLVRPALAATGVTTRQLQELEPPTAQAESDIYWDRVASIEPRGEEEVYDLTVEGHHNFVCNEIIVHNSIEQDADVVCFLYRHEYYDEEDEDAKGKAEVIVAKHRNGPVGSVELAFQAPYPRFRNMARGGSRGNGSPPPRDDFEPPDPMTDDADDF